MEFVFCWRYSGGWLYSCAIFSFPKSYKGNSCIVTELKGYGIDDYSQLVPSEIFSWESLFTLRGFILLIGGGFLVGFGSRYAGGCTSGHAIMGLSNLQVPSLIATMSFMVGGFIMANLILPFILKF